MALRTVGCVCPGDDGPADLGTDSMEETVAGAAFGLVDLRSLGLADMMPDAYRDASTLAQLAKGVELLLYWIDLKNCQTCRCPHVLPVGCEASECPL